MDDYDTLLDMKKEIDELSLYEQALKDKIDEINDVLYGNNMNTEVMSEEDRKKLIDKKVRDQKWSFTLKKIVGYWIRYMIIFFAKEELTVISGAVFTAFTCINLAYYCYCVLEADSIVRKRVEQSMPKAAETDYDALTKERDDLSKRLNYVSKKHIKLSREYDGLVAKLGEYEYQAYLGYLNEYLQYALEHSKELLSEACDNVKYTDYEYELDTFMEDENDRPYHLK